MIKMSSFITLLVLMAVFSTCYGQSGATLDSLKIELKAKRTQINRKISILNILSKEYRKIDQDSALTFAKESLRLSKIQGFKHREGESLLRIGDVFRTMQSYETAKSYYEEGIILTEKNADFKFAAKLYNNLGLLHKNKNNLRAAIISYKKSAFFKKELSDLKGLSSTLHNIARTKNYLGEYDSALSYFKESLKIRKQLGDRSKIGSSYQDISILLSDLSQFDSSIHYSELAVMVYQEDKDEQSVAEAMNNMGLALMYKADYEEALRYYLQSIKKYDSIGLGNRAAYVYQNIGLLFERQGLYKKAEFYVQQSIPFYEKTNDSKGLGHAYHYLASLSMEQNKYEEAVAFDLKSLAHFDSLDSPENVANIHNSLGQTYHQMEDYLKAKEHLSKSLKLKKESGNERSLANLYNSIGANHFYQGQYGQAIVNYQKSVEISNRIGELELERRALFGLAEAHQKKRNYSQVYKYFSRYNALKDTLFSKGQSEALAEMQTKYETEKKEKEIARLQFESEIQEAQTEKKEAERNVMIIASLLLLLLSGAIYLAYRLKQKANQKLAIKNGVIQQQVKERELLHRELHHRVKNNLQLISSIMGLQSFNAKDAKVSRAIQEGKSRVEAMTLIHRNLYRTDNVTHVNIKEYIDKLAANIRASFGEDFSNVTATIDDVEVKVDDVIPIGLIVNEVLCNTFKHGKSNSDQLAADITFHVESDHCILCISDNGGGIPDDAPKDIPGFGMGLINSLTRQLKGELFVQPNDEGTTISLKLKKDILAEKNAQKIMDIPLESGQLKTSTHA